MGKQGGGVRIGREGISLSSLCNSVQANTGKLARVSSAGSQHKRKLGDCQSPSRSNQYTRKDASLQVTPKAIIPELGSFRKNVHANIALSLPSADPKIMTCYIQSVPPC